MFLYYGKYNVLQNNYKVHTHNAVPNFVMKISILINYVCICIATI